MPNHITTQFKDDAEQDSIIRANRLRKQALANTSTPVDVRVDIALDEHFDGLVQICDGKLGESTVNSFRQALKADLMIVINHPQVRR